MLEAHFGKDIFRPFKNKIYAKTKNGFYVRAKRNERHEDHKRIEETIHVFDFIKRLIIHIPDHQFKMIRYYGIYTKKHKFHGKMFMLFNKKRLAFLKALNSWQLSILLDFNRDPINCPRCGCKMIFVEHFCQKCDGIMTPVSYTGINGVNYQFNKK